MRKPATLSAIMLALTLSMGMGATSAIAANDADDSKSAGEAVSDTWITTKVKTELATVKGLKSRDISVETNDGVVTLTGVVGSSEEMKKAESATQSVKGVKDVDTAGLKEDQG